ncbi:glycosyltransferase [Arenimonas sp.]|uniref:glycosyltransferase n=1 Tax=Arenimonas sp. TaxID=1872635 RepID=UPI0035B3F1C2
MRRVRFHRRFHGYSGGHGKVRDYVGHVDAHPGFEAETWLTADSVSDGNPWATGDLRRAAAWDPDAADVLFLAGLDWEAVPDDRPGRPVINLVQHLRHADAHDARRPFLRRPALRICVSQAVADAILATGEVNGPVHVIPAALDLPALPARPADAASPVRVVIAAGKAPALAAGVAAALSDTTATPVVLPAGLRREEFLAQLGKADIAVMLPHEREGFYLPGLEAMALGAAVVMPDAGGNREYLDAGGNALVPAREAGDIATAVRLLLDDAGRRSALAAAGPATAARYTLARERAAFHALLDRLDTEWAACRHAC